MSRDRKQVIFSRLEAVALLLEEPGSPAGKGAIFQGDRRHLLESLAFPEAWETKVRLGYRRETRCLRQYRGGIDNARIEIQKW